MCRWIIPRASRRRANPFRFPIRIRTVGGSINIVNATNWQAPAYNPQTGLVYVNSVEGKAIYYLTDDSEQPSGYGGTAYGIGCPRVCCRRSIRSPEMPCGSMCIPT